MIRITFVPMADSSGMTGQLNSTDYTLSPRVDTINSIILSHAPKGEEVSDVDNALYYFHTFAGKILRFLHAVYGGGLWNGKSDLVCHDLNRNRLRTNGVSRTVVFRKAAAPTTATPNLYALSFTFSKRSFTPRSNLGVSTGMYLQMIAIMEPVMAIHTTEMAAGTRASKVPKCSFARRKPNADDFMEVSMAIVRDDTSEKPIALGSCWCAYKLGRRPGQ